MRQLDEYGWLEIMQVAIVSIVLLQSTKDKTGYSGKKGGVYDKYNNTNNEDSVNEGISDRKLMTLVFFKDLIRLKYSQERIDVIVLKSLIPLHVYEVFL